MIKDILRQYKGKDDLVEVYTNPNDTSKFHIGRIIACNNDYNVMVLVTPYGLFDGYQLEKIDLILNIQHDTLYIKNIQKLMKHHKTELPTICLHQADLVGSFLNAARCSGSIARMSIIKSDNIDGQGYIDAIEDGVCKVLQINDQGINDGYGFLKLEDIESITFKGEDEIKLQILYEE